MLERGKMDRGIVEIVDTESLVPKDHLLRKIDAAVDFNRLYEMVEPLYSEDNGRPSVDPVVLFKMVLIQHLYGLPSLRRTADEISANICYRWFLGYTLQEETPHFSTVSYNFRHRFTAETVDQVFAWILEEVAEAGYLSPKAVFIDGTHIKANANTKKQIKEQVPVASKHYTRELMEEVNADREAHGKKPFDDDDEPPTAPKKRKDNTSRKKLARRKKEKTHTVTKSITDPDCGLFVKGEHKRQFAYEAHTACDKNGFVLETIVTPGNVHDSVAFDEVYDKVTKTFPETETIVADSAYKTSHICKKVFDDGRVLSTAYKRPQTMKGGHEWWKYVYDEFYDCVICPEYQLLKYATTNRDGYREYKSDPKICTNCPSRERCTHSKDCVKTVQRHIWKHYEELADDARYTPKYQSLYRRRKETIERIFADAKEKHAMRYTQYRGLAQVTNWVKLKFAAMNLKKLATRKWKECFIPWFFQFPPLNALETRFPQPGFSTDWDAALLRLFLQFCILRKVVRFAAMANIFLLEDDKILSKGISIALKKDEHMVTAVYGYLEALKQYQKQKYDLFLLDINLPDGNGLEFCEKIRETSETPVLFLTANDTEEDMLEGFGVGCDDYISKPFSIEVLRKKVLAVLKRSGVGKFRMKYRDLELDKEKCLVLMKGQEIHLTSTEYKLLLYLMENRGRVVTKAMLLEQLWDIDGNFVDDNTVRVNIKRLRQKLNDEKQEYIVTVFGMGYSFGE